jgi:MFS family permease
MLGVLRVRDFRLLFTGEGVSLLGDQFYFIALPWLILQLSAGTVVLGGVLAVQGVTRAAFMLVGGAVTDRLSPRRVMIGSNVARLAVVGLLAALVLAGDVRVWALFALVAAYGVADGFFFPAQTAIVPQLATVEQLPAANAVIQGLDQVAQFVGPVLAGVLIASFVGGRLGLAGVGAALVVDAATFAVSVALLLLMRVDAKEPGAGGAAEVGEPAPGLWTSIHEGLAYMWSDPLLRLLLLLVLAVNFFAVGPLLVGVPVLAHERLAGAQAYGAVMSAFGGGSLAGLAVAGAAPRPPARLTGHVLLSVCAVFGVGMAVLGFAHSLPAALAPSALMGFAAGYLMVSFFTWIQARTPQRFMGRMMSLIIFASVGLVPVSQALSGLVAGRSVGALFLGAAALLALVVARAWWVPSLRAMGLEMATAPTALPEPAPAVPPRDGSVMADGDQQQPGEDERRPQPLRRAE